MYKLTKLGVALSIFLSTALLPASTIAASKIGSLSYNGDFSPDITGSITSPVDGTSSGSNKISLTMSVNANGNTSAVGRTLDIIPMVMNSSTTAPATATDSSEVLYNQLQQFTFSGPSDTKTFTFPALPMLYPGGNYYVFFVEADDGTNGGVVGGYSNPVTTQQNYTGNDFPVYRFYSSKFTNAHFFTQNSNEKENLINNDNSDYGGNWAYESTAFTATKAVNGVCTSPQVPVYRFYSSRFGSHFYTANATEKNNLMSDSNWAYEAVAYCADTSAVSGTTSLYRFWSPAFGKHFFTADPTEAQNIIDTDPNWNYEGVSYYVQP